MGRIIATSKYYGKSPDNFLLQFKNAIRAWVGEAYNLFIKYDLIALGSDAKVLKVDCVATKILCYLDEDFYVLTNTAAGEAAGAEGLTGLAKSFFYAGARSLLASHWAVRDDLAAILSSKTVALELSDISLSRAQALRQTMLAVRNDPDDDTAAHPSSWAPFMLVGDGR